MKTECHDKNECKVSCKEKLNKLIKPILIIIAAYFISKFFTKELTTTETINYGAGIIFIISFLIFSYVEKVKFEFRFNFRVIYGWLIFMPLFLSKQCSIDEHNVYVMITGVIVTVLVLDIVNFILNKYIKK